MNIVSNAWLERCAERLIAWRRPLLILFLALTALFGFTATKLKLDPGFNKMIPLKHEYMRTFVQYGDTFSGANRIVVNLRWKGQGDIYNKAFLDTLRKVTDEVFFLPGVQRTRVFSLFTPNVRYIEVTEKGYVGDVVVPARFTGSQDDLDQVRRNVARSGEIGSLVANDLKGALIRAELQEVDPSTGKKLDYVEVARRLEEIRHKFAGSEVEVKIIGFAKVVGDVEAGLNGVLSFFVLAFAITALLLLGYSRSLKLTVVALLVALLPVVWLLGLLPLLGRGIDPMSILVPFLIFSIGVSHAVQMTNAWKQEKLAGADAQEAARRAFQKLFIPGAVALLTNALGFLVIMQIDIEIVRELGISACLGVLLMIVTNKLMLPIVLSWLQLEPSANRAADRTQRHPLWWRVSGFAERKTGLAAFAVALALLAVGTLQSRHLTIGDIGSGVPELRDDSRYNRDNSAIVSHYNVGVDVLSVIVETKGYDDACLHYPVMAAIDRFELFMRGVAGVQSVMSVPSAAKVSIAASNEGHPRWQTLLRTRAGLAQGSNGFNPDLGLNNDGCSAIQLLVYPKDHQGTTIAHIVAEAKRFIAGENVPNVRFRLAGGNVGVMAATNEAVEAAEVSMLLAIFGAITLLCFVTFRSWKAVLCIIVPLTIVSILCNALMALLGIGLKVSTLPVIALGVGVGVDYGIYLFERIQHQMHEEGQELREAFYQAMCQRGTAAAFTAVTMAAGVATWSLSALKFQADMGILLAFMFLVNLLGAVFLLPALAVWLGVGAPAAQGRRQAVLSKVA
jgi:predicted RND superfamily exporter protein